MSKRSEDRAFEWIKWYHYNKERLPREDVIKQLEFQKKAIDGVLELVTHLLEDIQELEGRRRQQRLLLPPWFKRSAA